MEAIQYSETLPDTNPQNQDDFSPEFEGKDDDGYSALQFLRALPHCPIIHWASQMCNET
jgi:hypothetical protein